MRALKSKSQRNSGREVMGVCSLYAPKTDLSTVTTAVKKH